MKVIITGAPCTGKTTLLHRIGRLVGVPTIPEAGRLVIRECVAQGKPFDQKMIYDRARQLYESAPATSILDRCHVDAIAHDPSLKARPHISCEEAIVWYLRFRPEWYTNDHVRTQTLDEAELIGGRLLDVYHRFTDCIVEHVDCTERDDSFLRRWQDLMSHQCAD